MKISLDNLTLSARNLGKDADNSLIPAIAAKCGLKSSDVLSYNIVKRSVDARRKPDVKLIYNLVVEVRDGARSAFPLTPAPEMPDVSAEPSFTNRSGIQSPVIIGAGPAGLFCAYVLALAGCRPVTLERGFDVVKRRQDIDSFLAGRILNPESNYLFGEGGAGTWSDGKLFTRIRDPRIAFVLHSFVRFGAQKEILYFSHPHVGSDRLPEVISNLRKRIIDLGGTFRWGTCAQSLIVENGKCRGVLTSSGERIEAPAVVSACGHSARRFILSLIENGVKCSLKGFQIGCRIEHPQSYVNRFQYGSETAPAAVGNADYSFVSHPMANGSAGGAATFCMCPGGEIIPSTSEEARLSTNGMSNAARNGAYANSAIVTSLPADAFRSPAEAFAFLDSIEKKVFDAGGGDYTCPAQSAVDFVRRTLENRDMRSSYSLGLKPARLDQILPGFAVAAIHRALKHFDRIAPGFIMRGNLIGLETHVSSPVRFDRDETTFASSLPGFYTAGEGAGMAGGITSSAADGIRTAEALLRNPF